MQLHIITFANESKYYYPYLVKSINRYNYDLITLGKNIKWISFIQTKCRVVLDEINNYNNDDIVCIIDGFDIICVRDLNELTNEFIKITEREQCRIVAGSDEQNSIFNKIVASIFFTNSFFSNIINGGTYIGYVEAIKKMLSYVINNDYYNTGDDEILINKYNSLNPKEIYIDINTEIFFSIFDPKSNLKKYININNNIVYHNNKKPFFIHAAGNGLMNDILIDLKYNPDKQIEIDLIDTFDKNKNKKIKNNINIFIRINKYKIIVWFILIICIIQYTIMRFI